jgi:hypothetical protein
VGEERLGALAGSKVVAQTASLQLFNNLLHIAFLVLASHEEAFAVLNYEQVFHAQRGDQGVWMG